MATLTTIDSLRQPSTKHNKNNGDLRHATASLRCIRHVFGIQSSIMALIVQNMKLETAQKRLVYHESIWAVKEIDFVEEKRKLQLQIGTYMPLCTNWKLCWSRR